MKILHVYRTAYPETQGGLEQVIDHLCTGTGVLGAQNRVFCLSALPQPWPVVRPHSRIYRVQQHLEIASCNMAFRHWSKFRSLVDWADLVHYHFPWPFADVLHLLNRVSKPSIITYHSDIVRQRVLLALYYPLMSWFLNSVDVVVATSAEYVASSRVLQSLKKKPKVIPIGLDETLYPPATEDKKRDWRQRIGGRFFFFVGVLRYYKGLHVLLESMKKLAHWGSDVRVVIAGKGPEEAQLKKRCNELGIKNVLFTGFISESDKICLYELCVGVVFPSHLRSEAYGVTLVEAAMKGKAMISTELGTGTSFINRDAQTGIVVPAEDAHSLAQALNKLWTDPTMASRYGKQARGRFLGELTQHAMAARYFELYSNLLRFHRGE